MTTTQQRGQRLDLDVLGEALASSPTALRKGLQQFETPPAIAAALCTALNPLRPSVADLQCGHGSLLRAAANVSCGTLFGLDLDPTARIGGAARQPKAKVQPWENCRRHLIHGDCTEVVPLLEAAGVKFDLLVLNPPWSLRWGQLSVERTPAALVESKNSPATAAPVSQLIDSTLWTFEAAHRLLTARGEGMLIANAATVRRLLEPHPLWRHTWLRLTLPNFFANVRDTALPEVAVCYFAAGHDGDGPLEITL